VTIELASHQYGKAETHLVHVRRDGDVHHVTDLVVAVRLRGDFDAAYLEGDNAGVLPTDSQKNAVFAFARGGVGEIEEFALRLGRHFVATVGSVREARVIISRQPWERVGDSAFSRSAAERRVTTVTCRAESVQVVSGVTGLSLLRSTGSSFKGFLTDPYTTLPEADDRILATAVDARWRFDGEDVDWASAHAAARAALPEAFAARPSLALQQTLYEMAGAVLEAVPAIAEVRLSMPNLHHFLVDLSPFGLDNPDEVYYAPDRPYGLIEGAVRRTGVSDVEWAW
jgi:urate oxidase